MGNPGRKPGVVAISTPDRLTREFINEVCKLMNGGNFFSDAVRALGVQHTTASLWRKNGRLRAYEGTIYEEFAERTDRAKAMFICRCVARLGKAKEYQATIRMLEQHSPSWRKGESEESATSDSSIDTTQFSDEELWTFASLCEKGRR